MIIIQWMRLCDMKINILERLYFRADSKYAKFRNSEDKNVDLSRHTKNTTSE